MLIVATVSRQYSRQSGRKNVATFNSYVATKAEKSIWRTITEMSQHNLSMSRHKLKATNIKVLQQINFYHIDKEANYSK